MDEFTQELGYEEPVIKQEEYWFYSTVRDAGELIRKYGADELLDELDEAARDKLLDAAKTYNWRLKT